LVVVLVACWLLLAVAVLACWPRLNADRAWRTGVLLCTLVFSLVHQLLFAGIAESAYIPFRYAENIAGGNGPVFNPGERVEGYSDFLWLITIALPKALFGVDVPVTAAVLGVVLTLGSVLLAYFLVNRIVVTAAGDSADGDSGREIPALGVLAAVLTAAAGGLAASGASGTETPLLVFLVLAVLYALITRHPVVAGVLVALTVMTRPSGWVFGVLAGLWLVSEAARRRASWWAPLAYTLGALVFAVPWTVWRVLYYGHLLPNSVVAESTTPLGERMAAGWRYLFGFSLAYQGFLVLAAAAIALFARRRGEGAEQAEGSARARSLVWLIFVFVVLQAASMVYAGGDTAPAWRLLAGVPPLLAVGAAACGVRAVTPRPPSPRPRREVTDGRVLPVLAVVLAGLCVLISVRSPEMLPRVRAAAASGADLREVGSWLGDRLPAGTVVSTYANGPLAFAAGTGLVVVDVLGTTDEWIAREGVRAPGPAGSAAADYGYVVNVRRPALAVTTDTGYSTRQRCVLDPAYAGRYQVATFRRENGDNNPGKWVSVYARAEQAGTLIEELEHDPRFTFVPCPS
jgi:arabinofuranosyltransferase